MRHLKTYQIFEATMTAGLTREQEKFLNNYTNGTWSYDSATGLVDVKGDFNFRFDDRRSKKKDTLKDIKFGKVSGIPGSLSGNFDCSRNNLTSLVGAPQEVEGSFYCSENPLESLVGAPQKVGEYFYCTNNSLKSLVGAPQKVGKNFNCYNNSLESLVGAPQEVGGDFNCYQTSLISLAGAPQKVRGDFNCYRNSLISLVGAPQEVGDGFNCDAFRLKKGQWNTKGWLEVLQEGNLEAQSLILPLLPAEELNKEIAKDPAGMIMKLKGVWNDKIFQETRSKLVWPKGYEEEADLVGDLDNIGF